MAGGVWRIRSATASWLERVDPATHRRVKGLRLVTAYAIAAMAGLLPALTGGRPGGAALSQLAAGFALWASVSEGETTRRRSTRDLAVLCFAAALGATITASLTPSLTGAGRPGPELILVTGSFLVGYLRRFSLLGAGIGSQFYLGELYAYSAKLMPADVRMVVVAGLIATAASIVPRLLSGPAERPEPYVLLQADGRGPTPQLFMGLQGAFAALAIVALNDWIRLTESAWAITACTYVIGTSRAATFDRVRRRIIGTVVGVPLGLACLPLVPEMPLLVWCLASIAMVIYAMALPERYEIACGAFAFTLIVTLAVGGEHSASVLLSRGWETALGGALGLAAAMLIVPVGVFRRSPRKKGPVANFRR